MTPVSNPHCTNAKIFLRISFYLLHPHEEGVYSSQSSYYYAVSYTRAGSCNYLHPHSSQTSSRFHSSSFICREILHPHWGQDIKLLLFYKFSIFISFSIWSSFTHFLKRTWLVFSFVWFVFWYFYSWCSSYFFIEKLKILNCYF